ncbi:hypothetical protein H0H87_002726 [Tephrocybe sp. NHM501043]|nr:hypothetical protein H0H87_002726 [Tephrocybe sp. NHM501043]
MLATQRMSPPANPLFAGNQAGAPLPLIPRRHSRESSSSVPIKVVIQQSSPPLPLDDSESSSSSDSSRPTIALRAKRIRSEQPETTLRRPPLLYSPGVSLRLTTSPNFSESRAHQSSSSFFADRSPQASSSFLPGSQSQPRLIRKKSGQLVKSSLKTSKSLSLLTPRSPYSNSKSAPATPTHAPKAVHFDAQLEHVKLFLAEQKPLAVSRDGSPTEDTASGTDSDFPDWIFGSSDRPSSRKLIMHTLNMPPRLSADNDVLLESLTLSEDSPSIVGCVRVANVAYAKSVVARFTFDAWQTTSEVSARYISSPSSQTDIFVFTVRLNDLMARIDGKRMLLAVRYNVGGREVWDNNCGRDYLVEFGLEAKHMTRSELYTTTNSSSSSENERGRRPTPDPNTIASLRSTLEKVVPPSPARPAPRYDFSDSLASRWVPPPLPHKPLPRPSTNTHTRAQSYPSPGRPKSFPPTVLPDSTNSIQWPVPQRIKERAQWTPPLASPRDVTDEDRPLFASVPNFTRNTDELLYPVNATRTRHHRRGLFAEAPSGSGVRITPPGTPPAVSDEDVSEADGEETPIPGRFYSFPPTRTEGLGLFGGASNTAPGMGVRVGDALGEDSELSTPSLGSSRETSPSPSPSPTESAVLTDTDDTETEGEDEEHANGNYKEFLNKFCFFTGTGTASGISIFPDSTPPHTVAAFHRPQSPSHVRAQTHPQKHFIVPRTQSASEVEDFLTGATLAHRERAVRSPSFDDVLLSSGAATPVAHQMSP